MIDREFLWYVPTKTRRILTRSDASHKLRFSRRGKNVPYQQTHGGLEKCPKNAYKMIQEKNSKTKHESS